MMPATLSSKTETRNPKLGEHTDRQTDVTIAMHIHSCGHADGDRLGEREGRR